MAKITFTDDAGAVQEFTVVLTDDAGAVQEFTVVLAAAVTPTITEVDVKESDGTTDVLTPPAVA